jgi:hypothetical protein
VCHHLTRIGAEAVRHHAVRGIYPPINRIICVQVNEEPDFFRTGKSSELYVHQLWVHIAVCELVAMNLSSFATSVGSRPLIFAAIVGSQSTLFASPSLTVCGPLQLPGRYTYQVAPLPSVYGV